MSALGQKRSFISALKVEYTAKRCTNYRCKPLICRIDFDVNSAFSQKNTIGSCDFRTKTDELLAAHAATAQFPMSTGV
jgi:hypothetical protein